jgi:lambda family phage portal protein
MTIYELQALLLREVIAAGGVLLHRVERPGQRIPLAIELIPEERFAADADVLAGRNRKTTTVEQGIEYDPASGRAIAYHVLRTHPQDGAWQYDREPLRIARADAHYALECQEPGQRRGWTMLQPAVIWLHRLGYYCDSELLAAQLKANWAYVITQAADPDADLVLDEEGAGGLTDAHGNLVETVGPGQVLRGEKGTDIKSVGPNVPGGDSVPWIHLIQQSIAVALDLSVIALTRDYQRVTFSATRAALQRDKKTFRRWQDFVRVHFCAPVWRWWVEAAVRAGRPGFPRPAEFVGAADEWLGCMFRAPGWESVRPIEDARANEIEVQLGTRTRAEIVAERGGDWDDTLAALAREAELLRARNLAPAGADAEGDRIDEEEAE